jgi:hypothetical protein
MGVYPSYPPTASAWLRLVPVDLCASAGSDRLDHPLELVDCQWVRKQPPCLAHRKFLRLEVRIVDRSAKLVIRPIQPSRNSYTEVWQLQHRKRAGTASIPVDQRVHSVVVHAAPRLVVERPMHQGIGQLPLGYECPGKIPVQHHKVVTVQ